MSKVSLVCLLLIFTFKSSFSQNVKIGVESSQAMEIEEQWVDSILATLNLEQKIGQLMFPAAWSNRDSAHINEIDDLIQNYHIGGLIFFQGGPGRQVHLTNQYQKISDIPLMVGIDAEWGLGMRLDSTMSYPFQMTLGAIKSDSLIYEMGVDIGEQLRRIGVHMNLAPVMDVNNNALNPVINFRSFGENPEQVAKKSWLYAKGMMDGGVVPVGKHFPGHGDTEVDSHKDLPELGFNYERLDSVEFVPFRYNIGRGLPALMSAHLMVPSLDSTANQPSTLSEKVIKGVLRDSLKFNGLIVTDAMNMEGVTKYYEPGVSEKLALIAGNDLILYPRDVRKSIEVIFKAVKSGEINETIINEKVKKILSIKYRLGLIQSDEIDVKNLNSDLNKSEYELNKRELIENAITVIRNERELLPLHDLDTLSLISVHLGKDEPGIFEERLQSYNGVNIQTAINIEDLENYLNSVPVEQNQLIIFTISGLSKWPFKNYGLDKDKISFIEKVIDERNPVLNWIGSPYGLARISNLEKARSVIITYEENERMLDYSAQLIFGGIGAKGRLPVSINSNYKSGAGLDTKGNIRFRYTIPEEVGMNGFMLMQKLDSIARFAIKEGVAPGIQVLVARNRNIIFHEEWGYHTYDSLNRVEKKDIYDLASVTKITGALPALMQFHDQGMFDLDATMGDYIPYFRRGSFKNLQIRKILSHNAGLTAWIPYWTTELKKNGTFRKRIIRTDSTEKYSINLNDSLWLRSDYKSRIYKMIRKSDVNPDQGYVYSGLSFYLWPEVVENLSGTNFESYLKNNIYRPLGASTLTYNPSEFFSKDRIIPTEVDTFFRKMPIHGQVHDEGAAMMDGISSNAGLFASTIDLAKIMQMYLDLGTYGGERYISSNTVENFIFCHYCNQGNRRGLAFDKPVIENRENGSTAIQASDQSFGHSGYTGTFTWADPENGTLFIFMSNRVYPTRNNRKLYELNIRPAMHQVIYDSITSY